MRSCCRLTIFVRRRPFDCNLRSDLLGFGKVFESVPLERGGDRSRRSPALDFARQAHRIGRRLGPLAYHAELEI
jgi:hypothetical protein